MIAFYFYRKKKQKIFFRSFYFQLHILNQANVVSKNKRNSWNDINNKIQQSREQNNVK